MPASKKPRKAYRPKAVIRPLNVRDQWLSEGDVHAALLALEAGTVEETHLAHLAAHADMVRRLTKPDSAEYRQAESIIRVLYAVMSRPMLKVFPLEEASIRAAIRVTLGVISSASNPDIYRVCMASMRDMDRSGGVRVSL